MSLPTLRRLLTFHFAALVAFRLVHEADDFNNWDLIGLLNANSFPSLSSLLARSEVHFANPFRFPVYNTGAESVLSAVMHRLVGSFSPYWSSVVVLAAYDGVLLFALHHLLRLRFASELVRCAAWALLAMSPVLLTFPAISAFDTQGYATVALALLATELVLQSRTLVGLALLVLAFLLISQAYGIAFFLPLFCTAWAAARVMTFRPLSQDMSPTRGGLLGRAALLATMLVAGTLLVHFASGDTYLTRTFRIASIAPDDAGGSSAISGLATKPLRLLRAAFASSGGATPTGGGFAPRFMILASTMLAGVALLMTLRERRSAGAARVRTSRWTLLAVLGWTGLVAFGYLPSISGGWIKSQRTVFGDMFLAIATAALAGWIVDRGALRQRTVLAALLALLAASDVYYLFSVLRVDHSVNHVPIYDYDRADGKVRHDVITVIERMHDQSSAEATDLIIYYPRGHEENTTDPALFFARLLRHFGPFQGRQDLLFPCRYCDVRYGCPFAEVLSQPCGNTCCFRDLLVQLAARPARPGRKLALWSPARIARDDTTMGAMLARLERRYRITSCDPPSPSPAWQCRMLNAKPRGRNARARYQGRASRKRLPQLWPYD